MIFFCQRYKNQPFTANCTKNRRDASFRKCCQKRWLDTNSSIII